VKKTRGRSTTLVISCLVSIILFIPACDKDEAAIESVAPSSPAGALVKASDCKSNGTAAAVEGEPSDRGCMTYSYSGGVLTLQHINAAFNCCPIIAADVSIAGNVITVTETEGLEHGGCSCLCLFDLDFEIENLVAGEYTIKVIELYLSEGDLPLEFGIDLASSTSGEFCVSRDHYPWGME
jgi:hypothetical protein